MNIVIQKPNLAQYQEDFLRDKKRFTVVEACTKSGKTFSHIYWLFELAHGQNKDWYYQAISEGWFFWWVAPTYSQAEIAFRRLSSKLKGNRSYLVNLSKMRITTPLGSVIEFKTADKADNLYGEDVYGAVFDEFTRAKESSWFALRSTLTATKGPCKFIGNYTGGLNWGHKLGEKAKEEGSEYSYYRITAEHAVEQGILEREEVDQARKDLPKSVFEALYMATGALDSTYIFEPDKIQDLFTNSYVKKGRKFISADIAHYGSDKFVVVVWSGWVVLEIFSMDKSDPKEVEEHIKRLAQKHSVQRSNIVYDADGLGSYLKGYLKNAKPFHNGSKPIKSERQKENYSNLKAQCYFKFSQKVNKGEIYIQDDYYSSEISKELEQIKAVSLGKSLGIIDKKTLKYTLGYSPDFADALIMRILFELKKGFSI